MQIVFSRHARRRAKLYGISENAVYQALREATVGKGLNELLFDLPGIGYPVVAVENETIVVVTAYPLKRGRTKMNVFYDDEVDALYLQLGEERPDGVIELNDGIGLDTTPDGKLVGIEILNASSKMDLKTIFSYKLELENQCLSFPHPRHRPEGRPGSL